MVVSDIITAAQEFIDNVLGIGAQLLDNPTTEQGQFIFQALAGIGGFVAGGVAAGRLSSLPDEELVFEDIAIPALLSTSLSGLAAFLVPTGDTQSSI